MEGGILRTYLSEEHHRQNDLAASWMQEAGLSTRIDAAGTLIGRMEGREPGLPALLLGSHLDSVPGAGRYDGPLGVIMALEVIHRLAPHRDQLPFAVEVVAFADEEGSRFGSGLFTSYAMAGAWQQDWWEHTDDQGLTLREAFESFGLDPTRIGEAARAPEEIRGYLEAHIEQSTQLEEAGRALGVVTSIVGERCFTLTVTGEARHAGGTAYHHRRDALVGAAEMIAAVEEIGRRREVVATVGQIEAAPGAVNVIPREVVFSIDLRAPADAPREAAWEEMSARLHELAEARGLRLTVEEFLRAPAVECSAPLQKVIAAAISTTDDAGAEDPLHTYSRAGHDGVAMSEVTEIGMLFIRCTGGISHHPDEHVTAPDVALGIQAFEAGLGAGPQLKMGLADNGSGQRVQLGRLRPSPRPPDRSTSRTSRRGGRSCPRSARSRTAPPSGSGST